MNCSRLDQSPWVRESYGSLSPEGKEVLQKAETHSPSTNQPVTHRLIKPGPITYGSLRLGAEYQGINVLEKLLEFISMNHIKREYLNTLEKIFTDSGEDIDKYPLPDLINILNALVFSEVLVTDKDFESYRIKVVKPGGVFYTWFPIHGTSIFNGKNNFKSLDYVKSIIESSEKMKRQGRPVIVVYSCAFMGHRMIDEMESCFKNNDNIIVLCQEKDLNMTDESGIGKLSRSDRIRLNVINRKDFIFEKAIEKASEKPVVLKNLKYRRECSLLYSDINNYFHDRIPEVLITFDGVMDCSLLQKDLMPTNLSKYPSFEKVFSFYEFQEKKVMIKYPKKIESHIKLLKDCKVESQCSLIAHKKAAAEIVNEFHSILRNEKEVFLNKIDGEKLQKEMMEIRATKHCGENNEESFFKGDNGLIMVSSAEAERFKPLVSCSKYKSVVSINFHSDISSSHLEGIDLDYNCYNRFHVKANNLSGYQLLKFVYIGHDFSWLGAHSYLKISDDFIINQDYSHSPSY